MKYPGPDIAKYPGPDNSLGPDYPALGKTLAPSFPGDANEYKPGSLAHYMGKGSGCNMVKCT